MFRRQTKVWIAYLLYGQLCLNVEASRLSEHCSQQSPLLKMWITRLLVWIISSWITVSFIVCPVTLIIQYTAAEQHQLRFRLPELGPPPGLNPTSWTREIYWQPRQKYIHRGSRRGYIVDDSKPIRSFWSSAPRPRKPMHRSVNHSVLASVARSASPKTHPENSTLNSGLLNTRSLTNKGPLLQNLLTEREFDFFCLSETWQLPNVFSQLNKTTARGFVYICQPHTSGKRGGGLAIVYNEKWNVSSLTVPLHKSFECIALQINGPTPTILANIYRPPKPNSDFNDELSAFLASLSSLSPNILLVGDFNVHMDNHNNSATKDLTSALNSFGLQEYVDFPTHSKGHILDLVCRSGLTPTNSTASDLPISDHKLISFNVTVKTHKTPVSRSISFRNIKNNDVPTLSSELNNLCQSWLRSLTNKTPEGMLLANNIYFNKRGQQQTTYICNMKGQQCMWVHGCLCECWMQAKTKRDNR